MDPYPDTYLWRISLINILIRIRIRIRNTDLILNCLLLIPITGSFFKTFFPHYNFFSILKVYTSRPGYSPAHADTVLARLYRHLVSRGYFAAVRRLVDLKG